MDGRPPRPFEIVIQQAQIDELRQRLLQTGWPDEAPDGAWKLGTDQTYLRQLVHYWEHLFDWRKQEQLLNSSPQFKVSIGGIEVHFIHEAGEGPAPMPILLPHGWPGSFNDFHKLIPMLTHPTGFGGDAADAFTVVVPSLPGHGFSFSAGQPRFDLQTMADVLAVLMTQVLGHDRFAAHGARRRGQHKGRESECKEPIHGAGSLRQGQRFRQGGRARTSRRGVNP